VRKGMIFAVNWPLACCIGAWARDDICVRLAEAERAISTELSAGTEADARGPAMNSGTRCQRRADAKSSRWLVLAVPDGY
jgi:hypothetical protein